MFQSVQTLLRTITFPPAKDWGVCLAAAGYAISKPVLGEPVCLITQITLNPLKKKKGDSHFLASSSKRSLSRNGHARGKFNDRSKCWKQKVAVYNSEKNLVQLKNPQN